MGVADRMTLQTAAGPARSHYCPECKGDSKEFTQDMEMKPTMIMPGRRMIFKCKNGHEMSKSGTILH